MQNTLDSYWLHRGVLEDRKRAGEELVISAQMGSSFNLALEIKAHMFMYVSY